MNLGLVALRYIQILGISVLKKYYGKAVVLEKSNQYFGIFKPYMPPPLPPPPQSLKNKLFTIFFVKLLFQDILQTLIFTNQAGGKI